MTQDERWLERYTEVKSFIESNHRNPSRHNPEDRFKYCNWLKHNKKLLNNIHKHKFEIAKACYTSYK